VGYVSNEHGFEEDCHAVLMASVLWRREELNLKSEPTCFRGFWAASRRVAFVAVVGYAPFFVAL